jgi:DNA polymerase I
VKQLITFRDAINPATGRIHASFIQYGADSGRFTARQPNCQNPSKHAGLRESVKPMPGNKFVICDYSGVEMVLMAALSKDETLTKAIKDGVDIHRFTASGILKKPMDQISKPERSQGKISGFALIYACSAPTLKDYAQSGFNVVMTDEEAERNREGFFELYKGIAAFHARTKHELFSLKRAFEMDPEGAAPTYETRTLAGRRRTLPYGSMTLQTATNSPTQGSGADCLLLAMGRLRKAWDEAGLTGWRIVNSIHDETVAEGPAHQAKQACQIVKQVMEAAGNQLVTTVPIKADASVASTWAEK